MIASDELTTDSVEEELQGVIQSAENLGKAGSEDANIVFGRLLRTVQKMNYLSQLQMASKPISPLDESSTVPSIGTPDILDNLDSLVQQIKQALEQIAKFLGAAQYTIGVQFPFTISVSITFTP
ncbi:MAG TPA: hypothetical protein VN739_01895 [Nitrososphaerales archaeon]|nr:hypothetical protein [Nitrososphaerales archaeon]